MSINFDEIFAKAQSNAATVAPVTTPPAVAGPTVASIQGQSVAASAPAAPAAAPAATPPKRRGRPPKHANLADVLPQSAAEAQAPADELAGPDEEDAPADDLSAGAALEAVTRDDSRKDGGAAIKTIGTLYVDCAPDDMTGVVRASRWVIEAEHALREQGMRDFRLIDFGKGKGHLGAAVHERNPTASAVVTWTRNEAEAACLGVFEARAVRVVRGRG